MTDPRIKALGEAMHDALFSYAHPDHVIRAGEAVVAILEGDPETYRGELAKVRSSLMVYKAMIDEQAARARAKQ